MNARAFPLRVRIPLFTVLVVAGLAGLVGLVAPRLRPSRILGRQAEAYFTTAQTRVTALHDLGNDVYAFQDRLDISLVIRTSVGFVVVDPFSPEMASLLGRELHERFPHEPVTHLLYSHEHLDHTRGGEALAPQEVLAHRATRWHFDRYGRGEVLLPTRYIEGDQVLDIGGRHIELLDFDHAHGDHLYAVYLPREGILYGPDLAFCRTLPPFGFPDFNHAGHLAALERASRLTFDTFVPSHFGLGDRSCVTDWIALFRDARAAVEGAFDTHGTPPPQPTAQWFDAVISQAKATLEPTYGDWHGFDEMLLPFLLRQVSGAFLGY